MNERRRDALEQALLYLAGRCDHAQKLDGQGFNAFDANFGHDLAAKVEAGEELTGPMRYAAAKLLVKYRGQLEKADINVPAPAKVKNEARPSDAKRTATLEGDTLVLRFGKDDVALRRRVKELPGRHFDWDRTVWTVPLTSQSNGSVSKLASILLEFDATEEAVDAVVALKDEDLNPHQIKAVEQLFYIEFPYNPALVASVKKLPGRKWNPSMKKWTVPASSAADVGAFAAEHGFRLNAHAEDLVGHAVKIENTLVDLSEANDAEIDVELGIGELFPFQRAGVAYALESKRLIIGDQMGLGKTVEALATLEAADAFPAVIVCPSSVKLNWKREIEAWLPGRSVIYLDGFPESNGNKHIDLSAYDIVILNYAVLGRWDDDVEAWIGGWLTRLLEIDWKAVVLDESHYIKNHTAIRTKAARELCKDREYRLLLSGTPVVNRPKELLSQLAALDRLKDFGGFWDFAKRYCEAHQTRWGWDLDGAANLDELHAELKKRCYVRRRKEEVLKELPAKRRVVIPIEIDNRTEYDEHEASLLAWYEGRALEEPELQRAVSGLDTRTKRARIASWALQRYERAQKAEHLVRIEALKQTAAKGKLVAVRDWVRNFLESGEKLVLFAIHQGVVQSFADEFDAPVIHGGVSSEDRQKAIDKFQNDPECRLIVCNVQAGGVGITLTAASDVAFIELGWTPAAHDQAEDRVHRIGQDDAVTAWYFQAEDTIEEDIAALLGRKRNVVDAVTDGR